MKDWQLILVGILLGVILSGAVLLIASPARSIPLSIVKSTQDSALIIDVAGKVSHPGVFELKPGDRVMDAIQAAGGLAAGANTESINLAALLNDGEKILVPASTESAVESPAATNAGRTLNLNTATADELDLIPGIGEQKAQAIIQYRSDYGNFSSVDDLIYVPGIGQSLLDTLRNYVTVEK
jgi:competence protein ComEA